MTLDDERELKLGDVIRFSQFTLDGRDRKQRSWAIIVEVDDQERRKFLLLTEVPPEWREDGDPIDTFAAGDVYCRVSESKVPGKVWAALAKWKLSQ